MLEKGLLKNGRRILYFSYPFHDDGAPHQSMAALWLARHGCEVDIVAWGNHEIPSWLRDYPTIRYRLVRKTGLRSAIKLLFLLLFAIRHAKPSLVYVQGAQQTPFLLWLPWLKGSARILYHTQDYVGPGQHWFYETCERFFARRADWVISNEPNRARFLASSYRLRCMPEVIRTALPRWWSVPDRDEEYRQSLLARAGLGNTSQPRLVVAGGAYRADRMSPELLEAFALLPGNYAIVFNSWMDPGSPSRRACEEHMARLGLRERVIFLGVLPFADLLKLYAACDIGILLYPNSGVGHFYQAPGRMTEYLRCGLPIVTSNFPGLELLTLKYELGAVANPYEPIEIAAAIRSIGDRLDIEMSGWSSRLTGVAMTELVYDQDAMKVFSRIIGQPCLRFVTSTEGYFSK